jgi:hypothetical protein
LADDLSIFELEKHGGVGTHLTPSSQAAKGDRQRTSPEDFNRQPVSVGDAPPRSFRKPGFQQIRLGWADD